jgi:hypothetical protein
MAYLDALGFPVATLQRYDVARCCVYLSYDLGAHLGTGGGPLGVLRWIRSLAGVEDIVYRWDDPGPGLFSTVAAVKNYWRHGSRQRH